MNDWLWFLTRSTGIVAAVLAVAALVWGFFFSARNTGSRRPANWWLALHNWLGGLTLGFIGAHMLLSVMDSQTPGLEVQEVSISQFSEVERSWTQPAPLTSGFGSAASRY